LTPASAAAHPKPRASGAPPRGKPGTVPWSACVELGAVQSPFSARAPVTPLGDPAGLTSAPASPRIQSVARRTPTYALTRQFMLWVAAAALFVVSCGREKSDYFPLGLGYTWNYVVPYEGSFSIRVTDVTGAKYTVKGESDESLEGVWPFSETDGDTGVYYMDSGDTIRYGSGNSIVVIRPLGVGATWANDSFDSVRVLGKEEVTVPAGVYDNCAKVAYYGGEVEWYIWFAPGVGIVKGYEFVYDVEYNLVSADVP
jgi:hypothetical protein